MTTKRLNQIAFLIVTLAFSWFLMMMLHELGHVIGALISGGSVQRLVLHPLTISRTDVSPNPHPGIVVWLGPILGSLVPLFAWWMVPNRERDRSLKQLCMFFAGFCCVANGAYIGVGAFERVGDCREMLRTGTPVWVLSAYGIITVTTGFYLWHRMGSLREFLNSPDSINAKWTLAIGVVLTVLVGLEFAFSPK